MVGVVGTIARGNSTQPDLRFWAFKQSDVIISQTRMNDQLQIGHKQMMNLIKHKRDWTNPTNLITRNAHWDNGL